MNEILQLSCDTSNPVQCNDKILIMGVSMKKEAYDHFLTESEEAQKKIEKILFDAKNKKSISKLKYNSNHFESSYWSKPLNDEIERRLARGDGTSTNGAQSSAEKINSATADTDASSSTTMAVSNGGGDDGGGETKEKASGSAAPVPVEGVDGSDGGGGASNGTTPSSPTAVSREEAGGADGSSGGHDGGNEKRTTTTEASNKEIPSIPVESGAASPTSGDRGITNGGAMPVEYDKMVNDLIFLRNKYDALLKDASTFIAQRDKFQEMFHRSRSEVIRVSFFCIFFSSFFFLFLLLWSLCLLLVGKCLRLCWLLVSLFSHLRYSCYPHPWVRPFLHP